MDWRQFWNEDHSIYVSARHRLLHADLVARGIVALLPAGASRVLDWGCGEAEGAPTVAARCARLYLYDAAPRVRGSLQARYDSAGNPPGSIVVVDETALADLGPGSLDVIVIVSVAQYLSREALAGVLDDLRLKLTRPGRLILADVIPRDLSPLEDAKALLTFAWQGGFLFAAVFGLVRTWFSNYRTLRAELGLTQWDEEEIIEFLDHHGFAARRAATNIGHNQSRMTFVAEVAATGFAN